MRGYNKHSGRLTQGGRGNHCSYRMGRSGLNQNCNYRPASWLGPLQPSLSLVFSVFKNLPRSLSRIINSEVSRGVNREDEKVRMNVMEQRSMQQGQKNKAELSDAGSPEQDQLTGSELRKLLPGERE